MSLNTTSIPYPKLHITGALALLTFLGVWGARVMLEPGLFALRFNWFALLSFLAIILNLAVLTLILRKGVRSEARTWFVMYVMAALITSICECFMRLSAHPGAALFWIQALGIGMAFAPVALYMFVLAYTRTTATRHIFVTPLLIITGVGMAFAYGNSSVIFTDSAQGMLLDRWGYSALPGPGFALDLIWIFSLFSISIVLLYLYYRQAQNPLLKKQTLYYLWAFLIPFAIGAVIDGILPLAGMNNLPNAAVLANTPAAVLIYRATRRYQLVNVDPTIFAQNILSTMREAVIVARQDLHIEFTNAEAEKLLGINVTGKARQLDSLFPKETWESIRLHIQEDKPLPSGIGELQALGPNNTLIPVQVATSTLEEGKGYTAYILVLADIRDFALSYENLQTSTTKIRNLFEESRRLQQQLADEKANIERIVEVRTHELRNAQERLKAEDHMKREFIALSTHNLATPLAVMRGSLEAMRAVSAPEQREQLLGSLENGVKRLGEFVEDMGAIATLESGGQLQIAPVAVDEILKPVIEETALLSTAKGLHFQTDIMPGTIMVNGNVTWLRSCIRNLLSNALKFTEKGTITLSVRVLGGNIELSVSDTGVGIAPEELKLLFTQFHRGTGYEEYNYEGEGLGLYLTKLIVEQHGGHIEVASALDKGSTFTVFLPQEAPAATIPTAIQTTASTGTL